MALLYGSSALAILALLSPAALSSDSGIVTYQALDRFELSGTIVRAENLVIERDRVKMTFTGVFYLETPVAGRVRGAVFMGKGSFSASAPPVEFELENVRRLLKADTVESDFQNAVLRFSDDTDAELKAGADVNPVPAEARSLAERFGPQLLRETGANVASRLALSILNAETPGFFCGTFDKGRRGRFTYVLDQQGRLPGSIFEVNAGESGLIFAHRDAGAGNDIWLAFHTLDDYARRQFRYGDAYDLVAVRHYDMDIDLHAASRRKLALQARLDMESLGDGIRAVPFLLNGGLEEANSERLKRSLRVESVKAGETAIPFSQEDWESGFTVFLPNRLTAGQKLTLTVAAAGDAMLTRGEAEIPNPIFQQTPPPTFPAKRDGPSGPSEMPFGQWVYGALPDIFYPLVNTSWYPRHGYLARSTFQLTFRGKSHDVVAAPGTRTESNHDGEKVTRYSLDTPVAFVTFAGGEFKRSERQDPNKVTIEYYSIFGNDSGFMLNELANSLEYFSHLFGPYPYRAFSGVFQPRPFGQGFPMLLLLAPKPAYYNKLAYSFIAHETAHQWWGDIVGWRSYRDQWLSEGFAEYSAILYTAAHTSPNPGLDLIRRMRRTLQMPPVGDVTVHAGKVAEIGPIALGHRLATRESRNGYQALIYEKGALVLRMLHFLLSDPETGDDRAFFQMLSEFVERNQGRDATTESFRDLAATYFARSPIGRQYKLTDLNWFFRQWVFEAYLPSYRIEYSMADQPDGGVLLHGTLIQRNAGDKWFMPLPVLTQFGKGKFARSLIYAYGETKDFALKLPARPSSVQLDPDLWILSDSTTASASH